MDLLYRVGGLSGMKNQNNTFSKIIDSTIIITLITVYAYFLGWCRIATFFNSLGIDLTFIEFPTVFFLIASQITIIMLIFMALAFYLSFEFSKDNTKPPSYSNYFLFLVFINILLMHTAAFNIPRFVDIALALICWGIILKLSKKNIIIINYILNFKHSTKLIIIFILIIFSFYHSVTRGKIDAKYFIEGKLPHTTIKLITKTKLPKDFSDKEYILILHHHDKYFLTEKNEDSKPPVVYIVPDDQVKLAIKNTVKKSEVGGFVKPFFYYF
ncbi:MAG: hypothetical protein NUV74_00650 [Candidatus Brocadiaceae bacterium]|nr:hypothetical protein [Candidatus Brocadiaceae bacterium]